jgi:hypothetical protein
LSRRGVLSEMDGASIWVVLVLCYDCFDYSFYPLQYFLYLLQSLEKWTICISKIDNVDDGGGWVPILKNVNTDAGQIYKMKKIFKKRKWMLYLCLAFSGFVLTVFLFTQASEYTPAVIAFIKMDSVVVGMIQV